MNKKWYVLRPTGQDEGFVVQLTDAKYKKLQERIDGILDEENEKETEWFLYEMDFGTFKSVNKYLDGEYPSEEQKEP